MATTSKTPAAKSKKTTRGASKQTSVKKSAAKKPGKARSAKAPAKKAVKRATGAVKKASKKLTVKAPLKKAAGAVKKTAKKIAAKAPLKKAVKAVKKKVATAAKNVKKAATKASAKPTGNKPSKKAAPAKSRTKSSAASSTGKHAPVRKPSPKAISPAREEKEEINRQQAYDKPLSEHTVTNQQQVTPVFTEHAENIEQSHITAQAVKTEGVPQQEAQPEQLMFEKPLSPADVATIGMNNKHEILNNLSVKHADSHKQGNHKIAGKKPLW